MAILTNVNPNHKLCQGEVMKTIKAMTKKNLQSSGLTLTKLLAAIAITGVVVTGAGIGLNTILEGNVEEEEETLRRQETNRALNFIADEVKMAKAVSEDESAVPEDSDLSLDDEDAEKVLVLDIPDFDDSIVYWVGDPSGSEPWQGPHVIYRWGPDIKKDGNYDQDKWEQNLLVDFVKAGGTKFDTEGSRKVDAQIKGSIQKSDASVKPEQEMFARAVTPSSASSGGECQISDTETISEEPKKFGEEEKPYKAEVLQDTTLTKDNGEEVDVREIVCIWEDKDEETGEYTYEAKYLYDYIQGTKGEEDYYYYEYSMWFEGDDDDDNDSDNDNDDDDIDVEDELEEYEEYKPKIKEVGEDYFNPPYQTEEGYGVEVDAPEPNS